VKFFDSFYFCGVLACAKENIPKNSGFLLNCSKLTKTPRKDAEDTIRSPDNVKKASFFPI